MLQTALDEPPAPSAVERIAACLQIAKKIALVRTYRAEVRRGAVVKLRACVRSHGETCTATGNVEDRLHLKRVHSAVEDKDRGCRVRVRCVGEETSPRLVLMIRALSLERCNALRVNTAARIHRRKHPSRTRFERANTRYSGVVQEVAAHGSGSELWCDLKL